MKRPVCLRCRINMMSNRDGYWQCRECGYRLWKTAKALNTALEKAENTIDAMRKELLVSDYDKLRVKHYELSREEDLLEQRLSVVAKRVEKLRDKYGDDAILRHQDQSPGDPPDLEVMVP